MSKLSGRKVLNSGIVLSSYYLSRWLGKPIHWGMPLSISFEPTTVCNLGCPECPSGLRQFTRDTGKVKVDFFQEVIDQLADDLTYLTFYFQGEPYLHPQFLDMVKYASERKIYTATSTNAHYLTDETAKKTIESGLDRLIISIDGTTQETYSSYRKRGSLEKVIEGTKRMIEWKKKLKSQTPHLIFQFLVVGPNEHQIEEVQQLGKELGVDEVRLKTAQIYDYENGSPLIPKQEKYSRYKRQPDGTYKVKSALSNNCWKLWHSCVVTWDGMVVPCCFDKDANHRLGDLKATSFKEVWKGQGYDHFRRALVTARSEIDICKNCTEGLKVWT